MRYRFDTIDFMAMTLRLDPELDAKLTAVAELTHRSKQQLVTRAIEEYLAANAHRAAVHSLAQKAAVDYPETLRRLGE